MKNKCGRPSKLDETALRKLEEAFALGSTDLEACFYAGISKSAFYAYQEQHPEFQDRKEQLKQRPILLARTSVVKGIQENPELALKFLERKKKDEFSLKQELEHSGNSEKPIEHNLNFKSMSDDELNRFLDQAKKG